MAALWSAPLPRKPAIEDPGIRNHRRSLARAPGGCSRAFLKKSASPGMGDVWNATALSMRSCRLTSEMQPQDLPATSARLETLACLSRRGID